MENKLHKIRIELIDRYIPILHNSAHLEAAAETRRHLKGIE